jgi:hypothetical protein
MKIALLAISSFVALVGSHAESGAAPMSLAPDSVVVRITAPDATPVEFSGVILTNDASDRARHVSGRTPFAVRLLASEVHASSWVTDGRALGGEIVAYRQGVRSGESRGKSSPAFVVFYGAGGVGFSGF